jgi:hypothetical protein
MYKSSPGAFSKRFEERKLRKIQLARLRRLRNPKPRRRLLSTPSDAKNYGPLCNKPDQDDEVYQKNQTSTEMNTREQNESDLWMEERRVRLTALNFGLNFANPRKIKLYFFGIYLPS